MGIKLTVAQAQELQEKGMSIICNNGKVTHLCSEPKEGKYRNLSGIWKALWKGDR